MDFDYIISLGFFCGVAQEIERRGFRDESFPFDWVISNLNTVNKLIENKFDKLFDLDYLYKNDESQNVIRHKNYKFDIHHDFDKERGIEEQLKFVSQKYERRINRFYEVLNAENKILFVCYVKDSNQEEVQRLIDTLNKFECKYKIIIIKNEDAISNLTIENNHILHVFNVKRDINDSVSRRFIKATPVIKSFFNNEVEYNKFKRTKNYIYFYKNKFKKLLKKLLKFI